MKVLIPVTVLVLTAMLACTQQSVIEEVSTAPFNGQEPALAIDSSQTKFVKDGSIELIVSVGSPVATKTSVTLIAPPQVQLETSRLEFDLAAATMAKRTVRGKLIGAGYATVTGVTEANPAWLDHMVSDMLGMNIASNVAPTVGLSAKSVLKKQGEESIEDHMKHAPEITSEDDLIDFNSENSLAKHEKRDDVVKSMKIRNYSSKDMDGKKTDPFNTVIEYISNTGAGTPLPETIARPKDRPKNPKIRPQGIGCVANVPSRVNVAVRRSPGETAYNLTNTRVRVYDENPWLPSSLIAVGYTDAYGNFYFNRPNCDFGAWWDYSGPDIYFEVDSVEQPGYLEVGSFPSPIPAWYNHTARSGTYWETGQTFFALDFRASNSAAEQGLWNLKRAQIGWAFNSSQIYADSVASQRVPMRVMWPSPVNATYAPISKVELRGPDWYGSYPFYHEFGHEVSYFLTGSAFYMKAYNDGPLQLAVPIFQFNHDCHNASTGCGGDHGYGDGFAHFIYDAIVNKYSLDYSNSYPASDGTVPATYDVNTRSRRRSLGSIGFAAGINVQGEESQIFPILRKIVQQYNNGYTEFKTYFSQRAFNSGFTDVWNTTFKPSLTAAKQAVVRTEANDLFLSLP
jgi:hypothetical protein